MSYKLDWIESALATNEDEMNMSGTLLYLIDPKSAVYLTGAELDFNEDMNDYGFKWTNPNAKKTCGCGASFS